MCLCNSYHYGCKRSHTAQLCSMPAMFKANERCYNQTLGLYGLETLNHRPELKILWDTFRSQIAELWFPYDRRIAEDGTWFYLLRSSAITIAGSQAVAEGCFHMIAEDRRTFCNLRSAIVSDHMETSLKRERFAVVWTTSAYDEKCSILSSYAPSACSNLIPGQLEHIFQA